jgi:peptidoglycan hydrolase-like protein with peptidoglycan-binding domain
VSDVVLGRAARCAGAVAIVAMLAFAAPVLASSGGAGSSGGESFVATSGDGNGGSGNARSTGSGASSSNCKTSGDSRHLGDRTLCQGMHGHDVRVLQQYLTFAGFLTAIDGSFGAATKQSVLEFQRAQKMNPNGVVTYSVQQLLRAAIRAVQASPPPPGEKVQINPDGTATAPADAPTAVQQVVAAANQILTTSYCVGGGHGSWTSSCYDCSGAVSYALHGAGLLSSPEDSTGLESYGNPGPGQWISVYADSGHAFLVVGGRAFDTANFGGPNIPAGDGPRWRSNPTGNLQDGGSYVVRHPPGL